MPFRPVFTPIAFALTLALTGCATRPDAPAAPIDINLVALNDFHGHLEATKFVYTSARDGKENTIMAGGIDNLAAALHAYRREDKDLLLVGAGDLVGGSPAMSSMWADEPAIAALNMLGMKLSSVGNHEFDQGRAELLRKQRGGCQPALGAKSCKLSPDFRGAAFTYLGANVIDRVTGQPLLPAFAIEQVKGVRIAFIGAVLQGTPSVVLASGIAGLAFTDEADAINKGVAQARGQGASVFVVLIHEGGDTPEPFDQPDCSQLKGPIVGIAKRLDPAVRLIISGHTHKGFQCKVEGRTITQAQMGGHALSRIRLSVDAATGVLRDVAVRNVAVRAGEYPADPQAASYLDAVRAQSRSALARPVARVGQRSTVRKMNAAGESALGSLIADAVAAATRAQGVQVGFMNMGGLRSDFDVSDNLTATFGQAQAVLPFSNTLVVMDMTGAQIRALLENQWMGASGGHSMLQVSRSFYYKWDHARPEGQRVVAGSMRIDGVPVDDNKTYRIVANNFLAEGGDGYPVFKQAANKVDTQIVDLDAFLAYLKNEAAGAAMMAPAAAAAPRIERLN